MPNRFARTCALILLLGLTTSCATTGSVATEPRVVREFCALAKPISWSSRDTPETIVEVKQHNAVGAKLCGWK